VDASISVEIVVAVAQPCLNDLHEIAEDLPIGRSNSGNKCSELKEKPITP